MRLHLPATSSSKAISTNGVKSSSDVFVYGHDSLKTGLSTNNSRSCSAESSKHASDPGVCFYSVCAGLAQPEKCSKGQERFQ